MTYFFQFERDFADSLQCIPMRVRLNLDTCGVKLKLTHWNQFKFDEKQALIEMACTTSEEIQAYRSFLQQLVTTKTGSPAGELAIDEHPPWLETSVVPEGVLAKATEVQVTITPQQWAELTPLERFALIKLSRPSHENHNFYPALKELKLV
jgi:hypothetical protein